MAAGPSSRGNPHRENPRRGPLRSVEQYGAALIEQLDVNAPLTVLSWNAGKGTGERFLRLIERMQRDEGPRHGADLLLLQEARAELLPAVQGVTHFAHSWRGRRGAHNGVMTVSTCELLEPPTNLPSPLRELSFAYHKNCLVTKYPLSNGSSLCVVNFHGINFRATPEPLRAQLAALELVLAGHRGPMILGGDFNTWQRGRMSALLETVRSLGLRRVRPLAGEGTMAREWYKRAIGRPFSLNPGLHLDHMFLRGLTPIGGTDHPRWCPELSLSDHVPLYAHLRFVSAELGTPPLAQRSQPC